MKTLDAEPDHLEGGYIKNKVCLLIVSVQRWILLVFRVFLLSKLHLEYQVRYQYPFDGTHLLVVLGLIHKEVPITVHQRGELN